MKRAAIIKIYRLLQEDPPYWRTDTDEMPHLLDGTGEQLLADLRTLAEFPNLLAVEFADARLPYSTVQVDVGDWGEAKAAAARVHTALGGA